MLPPALTVSDLRSRSRLCDPCLVIIADFSYGTVQHGDFGRLEAIKQVRVSGQRYSCQFGEVCAEDAQHESVEAVLLR